MNMVLITLSDTATLSGICANPTLDILAQAEPECCRQLAGKEGIAD